MLLYIVIAYDEYGDPYVVSDHLDQESAWESAGDSNGFIRTVEISNGE
jgi:hypothetical protein